MTQPFAILANSEPDIIDLELMRAGAALSPEQRRVLDEGIQDSLAPAQEELEAFSQWWDHCAPALPQALSRAQAPAIPLPGRAPRWLWALAAAVLVAVVVLPQVLNRPPEIRSMGSFPVDLQVEREGQQVTPHPAAFRQGDRLALSFRAPTAGWVSVGTVQDDGEVFLLWTSPQAVTQGQRVALDKAILLDDHDGQEWLMVQILPQRASDSDLEEDLRELPRNHNSASHWTYEVTRRP